MAEREDYWLERTERLIGSESITRLREARVTVVGLGGVGAYALEMLCRAGIGTLRIIDADTVAVTNLNRQLPALHSTIGLPKTDVLARRCLDINPDASIQSVPRFVDPSNIPEILGDDPGFVVDAIDTVAPKTALLAHCLRNGIPVVSSMGAGGRIDPTKIGYSDLWKTGHDGLAKAVRQNLRKLGVTLPLTVVASSEPPASHSLIHLELRNKMSSFGTLPTIPSIFGIMLANHVILKLADIK